MTPAQGALVPTTIGLATIRHALSSGMATARHSRRIGSFYAGVIAAPGLVMMYLLREAGMTPMIPLMAGAFMLLAPTLLAGFFGIARAVELRGSAKLGDLTQGFRQAPSVLLVLSLVCALLFMIFVTDVAVIYSYKIGGNKVALQDMLQPATGAAQVLIWGSLSGIFLGLIVFCISAFSVPLLCERRAGLIRAVIASVHAVGKNLWISLLWAALIALSTVLSILLLPLLPLTLPPLAYASHALYRQVFPLQIPIRNLDSDT